MTEIIDYHAQSRGLILEYLHGKSVVAVNDIILYSNAEKLRVYPILFELEQDGVIDVVSREDLGAAKEVRLK